MSDIFKMISVADKLRRPAHTKNHMPKTTPEIIQRIIKRRADGMTLKAIAESVGLSSTEVGRILKKHGLGTSKKKTQEVKLDEAGIIKCWNLGLSTSAICERFSCSESGVKSILRRHGIEGDSAPRTRYDGQYHQDLDIESSKAALIRIALKT